MTDARDRTPGGSSSFRYNKRQYVGTKGDVLVAVLRDDEPLLEYLPNHGWWATRYFATSLFWRVRLSIERDQQEVSRWKVGVIRGSRRELQWDNAMDAREGLTFSEACTQASVLAARYSDDWRS